MRFHMASPDGTETPLIWLKWPPMYSTCRSPSHASDSTATSPWVAPSCRLATCKGGLEQNEVFRGSLAVRGVGRTERR